jgi:biotin synthase
MKATGSAEKIRVSVGSAMVLGLKKGIMDVKPTTAYLLLGRERKCLANCSFCPQAKHSNSRADLLSRVTWQEYSTQKVISSIENAAKTRKIKRVCVQCLNYPEVFDDIVTLVRRIKENIDVPISVSCKPPNKKQMEEMHQAGVNRLSLALDAATEQIFEKIKGTTVGANYTWKKRQKALQEAVNVFGEGFVGTHLIVGLGETEKQLCQTIQWCVDSEIKPALFAFTPIKGTPLEKKQQPELAHYRRIQVAHHLLVEKTITVDKMKFDKKGQITGFGVTQQYLMKLLETGEPFLTSGCPDCNRPYYNEKPRGPFYNYPRCLLPKELEKEKRCFGCLNPNFFGFSH